ncbi:MAG: TolC family protein [Myxococcota bacterium]
MHSNPSKGRTRRVGEPWAAFVLALAIAAAVAGVAAGRAGAEAPPTPLTLAWAVARAARANPTLAVDEARRDAARERVVTAGSLDDPRIAYEASNVPTGDWDFESTPLSGHQLGLRQKLPFPGVLHHRRGAAKAGLEASERALDDERLRVAAKVERAWSELGYQQRALAITRRNIALLRQLSTVAEAKYGVGEGLQQDVIRAQVELTSLLQEEIARVAAVETAGARLAELLDLDLAPDVRLPGTGPLEEAAPVPGLADVAGAIEQRSPRLRAAEARVEEARRRVRVAELEGLPDIDLGIGYRVREDVKGDVVDGDDFVSAGLTLRLPVNRRKWRAHAAEARADLRRARAEYRDLAAGLRFQVRAAHAELVRADAQARLLRTGLLPQARQSLQSSRAGYEVGRIDFLSLLDSQVSLLSAELREVRALADRRVAFAALEAAVGEVLR